MKKFLDLALSANQLRKTFGYTTIVEAMKNDLRLKIINKIEGKNNNNILILSPHPDDDVFGCGGTIIKHIKNGDKVNILYFCDGSHGTKDGKRDSSLIKIRKSETKKTAEILGIDNNNLYFLDNEDGKLFDDKKTIDKFSGLVQKLKPQIIYSPSILDNNPDHETTNKIFYKYLNCHSEGSKRIEESLSNILISMYEIWTPILPNRLINITDVIDIKKKAMQVHKSQLICRDYDQAILALNKYRATINGIKGHAEGFFICSPKIYKTFFKKCPV